jgi:hypothetical protein
MPKYYLIQGKLMGEGFLKDVSFQFHEKVYVSENSITDQNRIEVGEANAGDFVVTDSLRPCQAVIAKLTSGEFAIYHDEQGWKDCDGLSDFIQLTKGKIEFIYVIQKNNPLNNIKKAPYLALELTKLLDVEVRRLHVEEHTFIIGDSIHSQVILGRDIVYYQSGLYIRNQPLPEKEHNFYRNSYCFIKEGEKLSLLYIDELTNVSTIELDEEEIHRYIAALEKVGHFDENQPLQKIVEDKTILEPLWDIITSNSEYYHLTFSDYVGREEIDAPINSFPIPLQNTISVNESIHDIDDKNNYEIDGQNNRHYEKPQFIIPRELLEKFQNNQSNFSDMSIKI